MGWAIIRIFFKKNPWTNTGKKMVSEEEGPLESRGKDEWMKRRKVIREKLNVFKQGKKINWEMH